MDVPYIMYWINGQNSEQIIYLQSSTFTELTNFPNSWCLKMKMGQRVDINWPDPIVFHEMNTTDVDNNQLFPHRTTQVYGKVGET